MPKFGGFLGRRNGPEGAPGAGEPTRVLSNEPLTLRAGTTVDVQVLYGDPKHPTRTYLDEVSLDEPRPVMEVNPPSGVIPKDGCVCYALDSQPRRNALKLGNHGEIAVADEDAALAQDFVRRRSDLGAKVEAGPEGLSLGSLLQIILIANKQ